MGLVVFGHSHRPELAWRGGCLLLNPGAAGRRRFKLPLTLARITVRSITGVAYDLHSSLFGQPNIASPALVQSLLTTAAATAKDHKFSPAFLAGEWAEVVDAWQI